MATLHLHHIDVSPTHIEPYRTSRLIYIYIYIKVITREFSIKPPNLFDLSMVDAAAGQTASRSKGDAVEFQNAPYELEGEYPFNKEFDPEKPATVSFDPFMGLHVDVKDVSDWDQFVDFEQYA